MIDKTLFTSLLILILSHLFSQNNKNYPSFNKEVIIQIETDSIASYALIASGSRLKETIILLHGLPGYDKNMDLAQHLRAKGKNVIAFNYRGSWGSQGEFTYANCLEDISFVLDYYSDSAISSKMYIDTSNLVLVGHSLGGGLALIYGAKDSRIKKIIAISALNFGQRLKRFSSADSLYIFQDHLASLFMLNCNPKEFVDEAYDNRSTYDVIKYSSRLEEKKVLLIDEFDRSKEWNVLEKLVNYKIINSDHSFTNERKELIRYINRWLN